MKRFKKLLVTMVLFGFAAVSLFSGRLAANAADYEDVIKEIDDASTGTALEQFDFTKEWVGGANTAAFGGTEHWVNKGKWDSSNMPGFSLKFKGTKIEVYGKAESTAVKWSVSLDGKHQFDADPYNNNSINQFKVFELDKLSEGEHLLEVTLLNDINSMGDANSNLSAQVDYAKVYAREEIDYNKDYETYINDFDIGEDIFNIVYSGNWGTSSGYPDVFYKGDEHWVTKDKSAPVSFSLRFYGTKIQLFGVKEASGAYYDIQVDGQSPERVSSYSAERLTKQKIYEKDGLEETEHTLVLTVTQEKEDAATGYSGEFDYAIATHKRIPPTDITFSKESLTIEAGMEDTVSAKSFPSYATNALVKLEMEDTTIATIDENGVITGLKEGTTQLIGSIASAGLVKKIPITITPKGIQYGASFSTPYRHALQKDYNTIIKAEETTWQDTVWQNDVLDAKIVTWTKTEELHNVVIEASDFVNGEAVLSSDQADIRWINETLANIGRGQPGAPKESFPDVIHKNGAVDIGTKTIKSAWISLTVPKGTAPGTYEGTIQVNADEMSEPIALTLSFEVLGISVPDTQDTDTILELWQHPYTSARYYDVTPFSEEHTAYLLPQLKAYQESGGRSVVTNIVEEAWNHQSYDNDPSMVKWTKKADGTFTFDYTDYDAWVNTTIDAGILNPKEGTGMIKSYSIVPWGNVITYYDESTKTTVKKDFKPGSDDWKTIWTAFLKDYMKHTMEKGWFDITYISMDERGMEDLRHCVDLIESIANKDGVHFKISSAMNYQSGNDYSFLDRIDDISVGLSHINGQSQDMYNLAQHRRDLGLLTTIYTCTGDYPSAYTISDMSDMAWTMWYSMKQGTDGFMRWSWDGWVEDPLTDVSYKYWEPGDPWTIYPAEKDSTDEVYYETPRFKMLKQGIRDINKAKYLQQVSDETNTAVTDLVSGLQRPEQGGNGYGSATYATEDDRNIVDSEVVRMRSEVNQIARQYLNTLIVPVTGISVDKSQVSLYAGDTVAVTAVVTPENATNKSVVWESSDPAVAEVTQNGAVTGKKAGTAVITVKSREYPEVLARISVQVNARPVKPEDPGVPTPDKPKTPDPAGSSATVNKPNTVKTGDDSSILLWGALLTIAGTALFAFRKKNI